MESVEQVVPAEKKVTAPVSAKPGVMSTNEADSTKGFGGAASPFNGVKLELGICIMLGILLWLGVNSIIANEDTQLLMLLTYSLLGTIWLVLRTRAVLRRCAAEHSM